VEAPEQLRTFSIYFLCDLHVRQLQLDELYAVLRGVKDGEISEEQAIKRLARSRHWVWTVCSSSWHCSRCLTISCCHMPVSVSRYWLLSQRTAVTQPSGGGHVRRHWRPD